MVLARMCLGNPRDHPQAVSIPYRSAGIQVAYLAIPSETRCSLCQTKQFYFSPLDAGAATFSARTLVIKHTET